MAEEGGGSPRVCAGPPEDVEAGLALPAPGPGWRAVSRIARAQAPLQYALRPAVWLPLPSRGAVTHASTQRWRMRAGTSANETFDALVEAFRELARASRGAPASAVACVACRCDGELGGGRFAHVVHAVDSTRLRATLLSLPPAEWLDAAEVEVAEESGRGADAKDGRVVVVARCFATGFLPVSVPLAPLLNVLLFWVPFASLHRRQASEVRRRMAAVLEAAGLPGECDVEKVGCW